MLSSAKYSSSALSWLCAIFLYLSSLRIFYVIIFARLRTVFNNVLFKRIFRFRAHEVDYFVNVFVFERSQEIRMKHFVDEHAALPSLRSPFRVLRGQSVMYTPFKKPSLLRIFKASLQYSFHVFFFGAVKQH